MTSKAWVFEDDINTDILAPGIYMRSSLEELSRHCLEAIDPEFATNVSKGDILVAGRNLGIGSSREQAVEVLKYLGIRALVAKSFGGIFFRNALNFGLLAVTCSKAGKIRPGDHLELDVITGKIDNLTQKQTYDCDSLPQQLLSMVADGGLVAHLEKTRAKNSERRFNK